MQRTLAVAAVAVGLLFTAVGCDPGVPSAGDQVEVSGKVPAPPGKSVAGFNLYFQPTGGKAQPVQLTLPADGTFKTKMIAGPYTYYLVPGKGAASEKALEAFPESYRKGSLEKVVDVKAGEVQLKF
jgi:hypothetical protein